MLLKSSSTPLLGSLISDQSPNNHQHQQPEFLNHPTKKHPPTNVPHSFNKVSFCRGGSQNFTFSCNSSPISPSVSELSFGTRGSSVSELSFGTRGSGNGFRRAKSEGNLEGLPNASSDIDEFTFSKSINKFSSRSFLETIPSFSYHKSSDRYEDEDSEYEDDEDSEYEVEEEEIVKNQGQLLNQSIRTDLDKMNFGFNKETRYANAYANMELQKEIENNSSMYLAKGLGMSGLDINSGSGNGCSGGGNGGSGGGNGAEDGDRKDLEEHYQKMVQDDPQNPLFLRNYAEFLYQTKQELQRAEEYYSRAILIDPIDGEILSQYAKLVWELHNDKDRATAYFERAVQAASEDSNVHAAYASFLWETEDEDEDQDNKINHSEVLPSILRRGHMASATA